MMNDLQQFFLSHLTPIVNSLIVVVAGIVFISIFLLWSKRNITSRSANM